MLDKYTDKIVNYLKEELKNELIFNNNGLLDITADYDYVNQEEEYANLINILFNNEEIIEIRCS
jgi:hypothetical protein